MEENKKKKNGKKNDKNNWISQLTFPYELRKTIKHKAWAPLRYETNIQLCSSVILIQLLSSFPALRGLRTGKRLFEKNNTNEKGFLFKDRPAKGY